jgi:hypothetical protein
MENNTTTTATENVVENSVELTVENTAEVVVEKELPKSKRKYLNPATGKMVAYTRAKMLGLV